MDKKSEQISKNCLICTYYECKELYDYRYRFDGSKNPALILSTEGHCFLGLDQESNGNIKAEFSRTKERDCCIPGVLQVALEDEELQQAKDVRELYELFCKKYETHVG